MAYNEELAERLRQALVMHSNISEKKMFGGLSFMRNDKMCAGVIKDSMILRCDPEKTEELLKRKGAGPFDFTGKVMKGWLQVNLEGLKSQQDFDDWLAIAIEGNEKAEPSKKMRRNY